MKWSRLRDSVSKAWTTLKIRGIFPYLASTAGAVVFVAVATMAFQRVLANRAIHHADAALKKGFAALAADHLDSHRRTLASTEIGCRSLVNVYFEARNSERLQWSAEACLDNGIDIPEAFLGLSAARELQGRDLDAVRILSQAADRFRTSPDFHFRLAQIFKRAQNNPAASAAYLEASRRAPANENLSLEALQFFAQTGSWKEARRMADNLKNAKTDSAEVKLLMALAYRKDGETQTSQALMEQARTLMASQPVEQQERIKEAFGELFTGTPRVPASVDASTEKKTPRSKPAEKR